GHVGQFAWREIFSRRDEKLDHVGGVICGDGQGLEILGEGNTREVENVRRGDACDLRGLGIEAEKVAGGFLRCGEVDAVGAPIDEVGVLVEFGGEVTDVGGGFGGGRADFVYLDDGDAAVGVEEILLIEGGSEG